jgi:UDP-glucuronate 4-epimerase
LENPHTYIDSNIVGFTNILEACRHHKIEHLIYASSSSVYGLNTSLPYSTADTVDRPISLYAATKKANELLAHTYSHLFGLPTTGLRFFTVYGPWGRPDMALFIFTKAILEGSPIHIYNNGKMKRDFTYIDDIVEGIVRLIPLNPKPNPTPYKVYNIGNHSPVDLIAFIEIIEKKLGKVGDKRFMPLQPGDVPVTYADVSDLMKDTGFKPDTPIEIGIGNFIDWYKAYYPI